MTTAEILLYLDHLEDNLDSLEESLNAFLPNASLAATAKKLPLLDRAKLHVTMVYAIESLIFSYLRLHNLSPHAHPVFKELARVKSYFDKIKDVENAPAAAAKKPDVALDKNAAERVIKHALAGNRKIDLEAAEKKAREALLAKRRLKMMEQTATPTTTTSHTPEEGSTVPSSPMPLPSSDPVDSGEDAQGDMEEGEIEESQVSIDLPAETPTKSSKKDKKISKKERKRQREAEVKANGGGGAGAGETPRQAKKKRKLSSITGTNGSAGAGGAGADTPTAAGGD